MRVEISEEQYKALRGTDVEIEVRKQYFLITSRGGKKSAGKKRVHRSPLDLLRVSAIKGIEFRSAAQKLAYIKACDIIPRGEYMASGELGSKVAAELKVSKDMGSYYVGELIKRGALEHHSD